jgi:hypothetical protein
MRSFTLTIFLFFILSLSSTAQQKHKFPERQEIASAFKILKALHKLDEIYSTIHLGTAKWVYDPSYDKEELRQVIESYSQFPASIARLVENSHDKFLSDSISSLFKKISVHVDHANHVMKTLNDFDAYVNAEGEGRSAKWKSLDKQFAHQISVEHRSVTTSISYLIEGYRDHLKTLIAAPGMEDKKDFEPDVAAMKLEGFYDITTKAAYIRHLIHNTFMWVYVPEDMVSKNRLTRFLATGFGPTPGAYFKEVTDSLMASSHSITTMLRTPADYQNPSIVFECESLVEMQSKNIKQLVLYMSEAQNRMELQLESHFADPEEAKVIQKRMDIIKLLENNSRTFALTLGPLKTAFLKTGNTTALEALESIRYEQLYDGLIPIYDRIFTHEEIKEILAFQNSKTGRKLQDNSMTISMEIFDYITTYINKVLEEKK